METEIVTYSFTATWEYAFVVPKGFTLADGDQTLAQLIRDEIEDLVSENLIEVTDAALVVVENDADTEDLAIDLTGYII